MRLPLVNLSYEPKNRINYIPLFLSKFNLPLQSLATFFAKRETALKIIGEIT